MEPARAQAVMAAKSDAAPLWTLRGFTDAVIGPFAEFFRVYGWLALLMLAMISLYRLPEFMMGPMANPFYHDLGLSKDAVGAVRGSIGLVSSLAGIAAGGFASLRIGHFRALVVGLILQSVAIANFALLAYYGPDLRLFGAVMAVDNFCIAFAGVALVTYMSSLTSLGTPPRNMHCSVRRTSASSLASGVIVSDWRGPYAAEGWSLLHRGGPVGIRR
jgi:PAT family beta-lactamase induction signal transducer AmpG